jgi:hypothetical protein
MQIHTIKGALTLALFLLIALAILPLWNKFVAPSVPSLTIPGI